MDVGSPDEEADSIDDIDGHELDDINRHIGELEEQELIRKRAANIYDVIGLQRGGHTLH